MERFLESAARFFGGDAVSGLIERILADARHAEIQPAVGDDIHRRGVFGDVVGHDQMRLVTDAQIVFGDRHASRNL